jgi:hypothetical protein
MSFHWQNSQIEGLVASIFFTGLLSFFFAKVEIMIEGAEGWAAALPAWRIEQHWLLDIFWGGRAMTGYHAWIFPFILLIFHFPIVLLGVWSLSIEAHILACTILFWIIEDFLWFLLNPAFGLTRFTRDDVPWHKHWFWFAPIDYWVFLAISYALFWYSLNHG